jgi:hypothetical protein
MQSYSIIILSDSWRSHGGDCEKYCLLGCDAVEFCRYSPTFRRNLLAPFSAYPKVGSMVLLNVGNDFPEAAPQLKRLVADFPPLRPGLKLGSSHVGFVVDKVALGQVFSEYFGFPCQSSFHQFIHNHPHLSSGAGTIGQQWPQYSKSHRTN